MEKGGELSGWEYNSSGGVRENGNRRRWAKRGDEVAAQGCWGALSGKNGKKVVAAKRVTRWPLREENRERRCAIGRGRNGNVIGNLTR